MSKKFAVIGFPLGHTMSPYIHDEFFKIKGISAEYKSLQISPENLTDKIEELKGLDGFNITIPHKAKIIPFLDLLDSAATLYGAVNTVKRENDKHFGYNTDAYGFINGVKSSGLSLEGKVFIYGYGGVARTIAFECVKNGCQVTLGVRKGLTERAIPLKKEIEEKLNKSVDIKEIYDLSEKYDLFVNATPVGMYPNSDACPLKEEQITLFDGVYDTIYNPQKTLLLEYAEKNNVKCGGGLSMLVYQAALAQQIWLGVEFTKDEIDKVIEKTAKKLSEMFSPKKNIVLCGFMGSGKSTIGKALAEKLNLEFIDTDTLIEENEGMKISQIFEKYGEKYFRECETKLIEKLSQGKGRVIALGGGLAANSENHKFLKNSGKIVFLNCSIEETLKRILGDTTRPLTVLGKEDIIKRYNERLPIYKSIADVTVDSTGNVRKTLESLLEVLR